MSGRVVLFFVAVMIGLAASQPRTYSPEDLQELPDCADGLVEPRTRLDLNLMADGSYRWFCPYFWPEKDIDTYSCGSGSCSRSTKSIGNTITDMSECRKLVSFDSYKRRVFTCMPWEVNPDLRLLESGPLFIDGGIVDNADSMFRDREKTGMWHLRKQFLTFKAVRQWYEQGTVKDQDENVLSCDASLDEIAFTGRACWYDDAEVIALKPLYKFKVRKDGQRKTCVLSGTLGSVSTYSADDLMYYVQPENVDKWFTRCKFYGEKIDYDNGGLVKYSNGEDWNFKDIQFFDYNIETKKSACPDVVTEACVDNVFSFYAKECVWVRKSRGRPLSLETMLGFVAPKDKESFVSYATDESGKTQYVLNLDQRNIEAWVNNEPWSGTAKILDTNTASLYFREKINFSCYGCAQPAQALHPLASADECDVPQKCVWCEPWQRVEAPWRGSWSKCDPSFEIRRCVACEVHRMRSTAEVAEADEECVPCPGLTPMRREGQTTCTACEHTQWFEASNPKGCEYFMSVVDGLSFTGATRFDKAVVDQYKPVGSTRRPEAVPAMYYRNLVTDGNSWNASTSIEMCPPVSFGVVNMSAVGVLARNVHGRRVQFRRWCGHAEILKADDAVLQPLDCGSRRPSNTTTIAELVAGSTGRYTLSKERRLVANRMGEIKLRMTADGFSCYYELRREGRAEDCRYCPGTMFTKDCGPTYYTELDTPTVAGPGTCVMCETQCSIQQFPNSYFAVTQFSCWSNGTARVQGGGEIGSLNVIKNAMSTNMNYWYKPATCMPCAGLSNAVVPQIVTRCGNKASFVTWSPNLELEDEAQVRRPQQRFCCALDRNSSMSTICRPLLEDLRLALPTSLCETVVPDLATSYVNFCPPDWFLDRTAPGCGGVLTAWKRTCCKKCELCQGAAKFKTDKYAQCSGGTDYDTQLAGCVASCAEKNYEVNGTCVACESCA